jgi:protein-L-isoaspartate(D-aspartate) O-methyltransferase
MKNNGELIDFLISSGYLKTPGVVTAFKKADRTNFVSRNLREFSYEDRPLPAVSGQTISQPSTVAFMLEQLGVKAGQKILDIGFGTGWTTALLSEITGSRGHVYALEYNIEMYKLGSANLKLQGCKNITLLRKSGWRGLPQAQPFDRILVSASAQNIPKQLVDQLVYPGRLVIPVENSILRITKDEQGNLNKKEFSGFVFVPFIEVK